MQFINKVRLDKTEFEKIAEEIRDSYSSLSWITIIVFIFFSEDFIKIFPLW
jgi:hypothetical protein